MNILIKAYARGGQPHRGLGILGSMLQGTPDAYGAPPSESTFNVVAAGFADSGELLEARRVIEMQLAYGFDAQSSFCALVRNLPADQVVPTLQNGVAACGFRLDSKALHMALVALLETPPTPDFERAMGVLMLAAQFGTPLSCKGCTLMLSAYKRAGREREGVAFFEDYLRQPIAAPDVKLFTNGLSLMVTLDPPLVDAAERLVNRMEADFGVVPDVMVFNNLIKGYGNAKPPLVDEAIEVFNRVLSTPGLEPTAYTFSAIGNVLSSAGRVEEAEELIMGTMSSHGLEPAAIHYNILMKGYSKCRCRVATGQCKCKICKCSNPDRAIELLSLMEARGLQCDVVTLQNVVEAFCSAAQLDEARSIVQGVMCNPSNPAALRPTINVFNMLMRGVCVKYYVPQNEAAEGGKHGNGKYCGAGRRVSFADVTQSKVDAALEDADKIMRDIAQAGLTPDEVTTNSILSIYCAFQLIDKAEDLVAQQRLRACVGKGNLLMSYNILFYGYSNFRFPVKESSSADETSTKHAEGAALYSRVQQRLDDLLAAGVEPDTTTLNTLVKLFADRDMPEEAEAIFEDVLRRGKAAHERLQPPLQSPRSIDEVEDPLRAVPNRTTMTTIMSAFARAGRLEDAQRVARLAESKFKIPLPPSARLLSKSSS